MGWKLRVMRIYLTIMLNAPSGVTRTAGAYMYATKLANSPTITVKFCTLNLVQI